MSRDFGRRNDETVFPVPGNVPEQFAFAIIDEGSLRHFVEFVEVEGESLRAVVDAATDVGDRGEGDTEDRK